MRRKDYKMGNSYIYGIYDKYNLKVGEVLKWEKTN